MRKSTRKPLSVKPRSAGGRPHGKGGKPKQSGGGKGPLKMKEIR